MLRGLKLNRVSFSYQKDIPVLTDISFNIAPGSFIGITGANGSGKSTLSYLLNGLIPHFIPGHLIGDVFFNGKKTAGLRPFELISKIGFVFQNPDFSLFNLTVEEEIKFGLNNFNFKNIQDRIKSALDWVGMSGFEKRDPQTLSFGQKQKINLACVLSLDTDYIILDEPTAVLDYKSSLDLYKILQKLHRQGKTVIMVEHDSSFLWQFTNEVVILDKGKLVISGNTKKILNDYNLLKKLGLKKP